MIELNDKLFLALARKAGVPSREALRRCKATQGERTLFATACAEGELTAEQVKKFERWAKQVKHGDLSPLEGASGSSVEAASKTPSAGKLGTPSRPRVSISTGSTGRVGAASPQEAAPPPHAATPPRADAASPAAGSPAPESQDEASAKKRARKRRLRQSSTVLPGTSEVRADESTKDTPGSPDAPGLPKKLAAPRKVAAPSERVEIAAPTSSRGLFAIAAGALVASACIGAAVAITYKSSSQQVAVAATPSPRPTSDVKQPVAVDLGDGPKKSSGVSVLEDERAKRALAAAAQLEREGRTDEAVMTLDAVLEGASGDTRQTLLETKNAVIARFEDQIDRARALAAAGKTEDARKLLASLKGHSPDTCTSDLEATERAIATGKVQAPRATPEAKKTTPAPGPTGKPIPTDPRERRQDELARASQARNAVTAALLELDVPGARKALEGPYGETDTQAAIAIDKKRVDAVAKVLRFAAAALAASAGKDVDLELRDGSRATGKASAVSGMKVTVATTSGDAVVSLDKLAPLSLLRVAILGAPDDMDGYFFGRGVLLAALGDRKGALEALDMASSVPEAATIKKAIEGSDSSFGPPRKTSADGPGTTTEKQPAPKQDPPVVAGGDEPAKPRPKTWMDDSEGGVPWEEAYEFDTVHYHIKTNVKKEYAQRWGRILEAIAEKYTRIFQFEGNDFSYKKNELWLYRNQEEFMQYEQQPPNVGGFYNPGDKRLHTFHGPWKGAEDATTLSILAHEAVHQFQNLVLRQMDHAPTFMIEGLSTFAEGTIVTKDGDVIVGPISEMRLKGMKRAVKANNYIHLKELLRTSHADFSGFHYAHTWALVHWCFFGPEGKKSQKLLEAYWDLCRERQATAQDFEQLVKQILGWDMNQLEKAWKDWITTLTAEKDPAIENYERKTHKKVTSGT